MGQRRLRHIWLVAGTVLSLAGASASAGTPEHTAVAYVLDPFSATTTDGLLLLVLEQAGRLPLFGTEAGQGLRLGWMGALAQDRCLPTTTLPDFSPAPGQLATAAATVTVPLGAGVPLYSLTLRGELGPEAWSDLVLTGVFDLAELGPPLAASMAEPALGDIDALCASRAGTPGECRACPHDESVHTCVTVRIAGAQALRSAPSMEPVHAAACDPGCDRSWENPRCDTSAF